VIGKSDSPLLVESGVSGLDEGEEALEVALAAVGCAMTGDDEGHFIGTKN